MWCGVGFLSLIAFLHWVYRVSSWRLCAHYRSKVRSRGEEQPKLDAKASSFSLNGCKVKRNTVCFHGDTMALIVGQPQAETKEGLWVDGVVCKASQLLSFLPIFHLSSFLLSVIYLSFQFILSISIHLPLLSVLLYYPHWLLQNTRSPYLYKFAVSLT